MVAATGEMKVMPWWVVLIEGIAAIILGILLLMSPGMTTFVMVQVMGVFWLVGGILRIVSIFWDKTAWGWKLFGGILGILAGIIVLQHPVWSTVLIPTVLVIMLGIDGLLIGIFSLIVAFQGGGWGPGIMGGLSIAFGIVLLLNPLVGALVLPIVLGILGLVGGVAMLVMAFRMR